MIRSPLTAALFLGLLAGPLCAQEPPVWRAWGGVEVQTFDTELPAWEDWLHTEAGVQRRSGWGAVAVEAFRTRRFALSDDGVAAEAYIEGWSRSYVHIRGRIVPGARVLPSSDLRLELFQAFGTGWEASAAARRMVVSGEDIAVYGARLARYLPAWYLRAGVDLNPSLRETSLFYSALARRYLTGVEGLVEASAGTGEEIVEVGPGLVVDVRRSTTATLRGEVFPRRQFGVGGGLSCVWLEELPTRLGVDLRLIARW